MGLTAILVTVAAVISSSQAIAQNAKQQTPASERQQASPGGNTREEQPRSLGEELNLTAQQRTNVLAVFEETQKKIEAAVQDLSSNADRQLQRILTPQQYQKLQALSKQHELQTGNGGSTTNEVSPSQK